MEFTGDDLAEKKGCCLTARESALRPRVRGVARRKSMTTALHWGDDLEPPLFVCLCSSFVSGVLEGRGGGDVKCVRVWVSLAGDLDWIQCVLSPYLCARPLRRCDGLLARVGA